MDVQSKTPGGTKLRLSVMMFLQYAIWGAWLPILWPYMQGALGFSGGQCANILAVGAVGAIVGPFIAGQIADRYFATERFLGVSHIFGAALVWYLAGATTYESFFWVSLLYGVVYTPTIALTNSLTFHHIADRDKDFGPIRLWGTIGWIVVGIGFGQYLANFHTPEGVSVEDVQIAQDLGRANALRLSAILGVVMSAFSFTLPHTPPAESEGKQNALISTLNQVRVQPLITLFLLAVPVSVIHQFYFVHASSFLSESQRGVDAAESLASGINSIFGAGGGGLMTIGQMTEIGVMALIPIVAKSLSRKHLLGIGLLAYAARMALFSYTDSLLTVLLGVALHGVCFGCFIFVAFMVVDEETTEDVRASAQNLFNLVIVGLGIIVGSLFAGWVETEYATVDGVKDYTRLFSVPMWIALACLVVLALAYPGRSRAATED